MKSVAGTQQPAVDLEDVFELPPGMRKWVVPRRGDAAAAPELDSAVVKRYQHMVTDLDRQISTAESSEYSDPELAAAVRGVYLDDLAAVTPTAAAITLAFFVSFERLEKGERSATVVDAWVSARGVAFAAEALVLSMQIFVNGVSDRVPHLILDDGAGSGIEERIRLATRMREHLVVACDADYAAAMAAVAPLRGDHWLRNVLTTFLFPERRDWVDEDILTYGHQTRRGSLATELLVCSIYAPEHGTVVAWELSWRSVHYAPRRLANILASLGTNALPLFEQWLEGYLDSDDTRKVYSLLARIPTDEAFLRLLDDIGSRHVPQAVSEAVQRFPRRGLRLLAQAAPREDAKRRAVALALRMHVLAERGIAEELLPTLDAAARARVESLLEETAAVPTAAAQSLPELLTAPPWTSDAKAPDEVVIKGLTEPALREMAWLPGEREQFSRDALSHWTDLDRKWHWPLIAAKVADGSVDNWQDVARLTLAGPEELVRSVLPKIELAGWTAEYWLPAVIARFGPDALPPAMYLARKSPNDYAHYLMPFACSEVATLMADWFARLKTARRPAQEWLRRHPEVAARTLIPTALGKLGPARRGAQSVLRMLAAAGFAEVIASAAAGYGDAAAQAVADLIADDGMLSLPKIMPELPRWAEPAMLPQVLLKGRQTALPAESARFLVQMLTVSRPDEPYAGLAVVKELCDARSLAGFAWALFENWRTADFPSKEAYALDALRWFGDDDTVRRLAPLIRAWPGAGGHTRAVAGLDVLAAIGGDTALLHLYGIAQKVKFKGLKDEASARVQAIADELGLTSEQLGDRLVPDLGLDADGSMTLDYGPRRFVVGFDEQLKPYVADEAGKRRGALPKPGTKDDAEPAAAAYQRFAGLKKDVRTLASDQIKRFERAMCARRRWSAPEFREYFVAHPLLRHLVRRLVWATFDADGTAITAFRVAEDLTFADLGDDIFALPDDAAVGIAHPLDLGGDLGAWSEVFADYEILQPLPQLGRPVFTLSEEEREAVALTRFTDISMPPLKVLGMERHGWYRSDPSDGGGQNHMLRELPGGRILIADLDPGLIVGSVADSSDQKFEFIWIGQDGEYWHRHVSSGGGIPFGRLDPVTASEILRDLTEATSV